ncbi:efflux RND transporter periplasmic adaptor subunit [Leptolyngbya ohadii]|uniref:efflux RND transporter periplasmic adaptor subunit n=1 Tax=Leptolyngbya ohadii TaxID=1962290 RepID=UPI000B5A1FF0|nr:HlyD family efflux transporter periplasmic adaptor subunit [Leptolyngbya ohadii]
MKLLPSPPTTQPSSPPPQPRRSRQWIPFGKPKFLIYGAIALLTLLLIIWAFRPTPLRVEVGTVQRGTLQVTVDAEGKTRVRDRFTIAAGVNGQLDRITLEAGDSVTKGTVVAQIDPLPQTAAVRQALAQLAEWRAQRAGVDTQRPKAAALQQTRDRIAVATANQQQAAARVTQAEVALQQAQRDRQRAQDLQTNGAISRQQREQAELTERTRTQELAAAQQAAQAAQSEIAAAQQALALLQQQESDPDYLLRVYDARIASTEAQLAQLQDTAGRTAMRSPVTGTVLRVLQKSAQFVSEGTPLLEIGDVAKQELVIDVLSTDAVKIKPGDGILINRGEGTPPTRAKVRRVEPAAFTKVSALGVEEQRVNVIGDFVDPAIGFGDGYRVDTNIVIWQNSDVLKVPLSALFRCGQQWCVYRVNGSSHAQEIRGRAERQTIELGHRSNLEAEVHQGLGAGETVILYPAEQLQEGRSVVSESFTR